MIKRFIFMTLVKLVFFLPVYAGSIPDTVGPWASGVTSYNQPSQATFLVGITADSGNSFGTNFYGAQKIDVLADVRIAPEDVGKQGVFYLVAHYNDNWFMKNQDGQWLTWDVGLNSLVANTQPRSLQATESLVIAQQLSGLPGQFQIFVGYKAGSVLHYNAQPFTFFVTNPADLAGQSATAASSGSKASKATFFMGATADGGKSFANSFDATQKIDVLADIHPDSEHVGQQGALYIVVRHNGDWYMKSGGGQWLSWDVNLNSLVAGSDLHTLQAEENLLIAQQLNDLPTQQPGQFQLFVGYKIDRGDIYYSAQPLEFKINPALICTLPQVLENGVCVTPTPTCISPQVLQNGVCVTPTPTCTAPQVLQNGVCVTPTPTCTSPQVLENGVCVTPTPTCISPQVLQNGVCVTPTPTCTAPQVLQNGVCVDQNIKVINFPNPSTTYTFKQTGDIINVYDSTGATLIAQITVREDGPLLSFTDGLATATLQANGVMLLGGVTVSSSAPTPLILVFISPNTPEITLLAPSNTDTLTLAWLPVTMNIPATQVVYEIHVSTTNNFTPNASTLQQTVTGQTQAILTGLNAATTYYVLVIADNQQGTVISGTKYTSATTFKEPLIFNSTIPVTTSDALGLGLYTQNGDTLTFDSTAGSTTPVLNSVLIAHGSDGYQLLKVNSIAASGSQLNITTSSASLSDVLDQATVSSKMVLFDVAGASLNTPAGVSLNTLASTNTMVLAKTAALPNGNRYSQINWDNPAIPNLKP